MDSIVHKIDLRFVCTGGVLKELLFLFCYKQKYATYYLKFLLEPAPPTELLSGRVKVGKSMSRDVKYIC